MLYLNEFLILAVVHFLAVVAPGPDFAVVIQQSVSHGRKTGIMTALGIGAGISVHVLYTILGFGLLLKTNPLIFNSVKVIAALYLVYLGYQLIRSNLVKAAPVEQASTTTTASDPFAQLQNTAAPSLKQAFLKGFITNATNPKATIFFLGIFTTIVSQQTPMTIQFFYGAWMCMVNAAWFILVAVLFTTQNIRQMFLNKKKIFEIVMGVILILLALKLVLDFSI
ncbi:RhtB (resistance to homoserine/threonine) family protein [Acinetobacter calcoaceticus]|uniref:RhtB (Resistance to homoserine/threonine) family protein n=1 Tax=Acinetobacter calcoaceticus TaxID=471 RepID=A0A4R1XCA3_ACICA|nr:RhtB (resistance to homoserine/threonine) family protein [Acinetobacter calcoaceticus]